MIRVATTRVFGAILGRAAGSLSKRVFHLKLLAPVEKHISLETVTAMVASPAAVQTRTSAPRFAGNRTFMIGLSVVCIAFSATGARAAGIHEAVQAGDPAGSYARMEKMIDVGGRKLHCRVYGNGSPTVVLVSGLDSPQASWDSVVPGLAAMTTVVTYDRAGVGKSEIGALPAHGEQSAKDLHALLDAAGVPKPFILVGHSFGGFVVRLFASMYPEGMAGLILEETQHEDNLRELRNILKGKDLEAYDQMLVDMFREPENPKTEADFRNITREQVRKSRALPRMPFVVLTCPDRAKAMPPLFSAGAIEQMANLDLALMNRLAASIPGGRHILVEGTGHYIHVDRPQALIAPVAEVIKQVREKKVSGPAPCDVPSREGELLNRRAATRSCSSRQRQASPTWPGKCEGT
jgi:pimeloyl-ACP methyl ester carboxylesterase